MAGNRVEELESKVRELEATVSGLTDELVETKERLQTLEEHTELELDDVIAGGARPAEEPPDAPADAGGPATQDDVDEAVESADPDGPSEDATGAVDAVEPTDETTFIDADEVDHEEEADEIGPEGSADGTNSGEPEDGGEDSDDIIVA
jgi:uncharacterized coiled-coil protein SlyX